MDFTNTPSNADGGSYEKPKPGKYIGVLIGFAYIGTHTGQFGAKPKVLLRWELHKRKGPSMDSKGFVHTITQSFGATVRGENSLLKKCIEAHSGIVRIEEGQTVRSQEWMGRAAWLDLEESDDRKYVNVKGFSRLDTEDDEIPQNHCPFEHWEPSDGTSPPQWSELWLGRSTDLAHLGKRRDKPANGSPTTVTIGAGAAADEEEIPF